MDNPSQYLVHLTSRGPEVSGADGYSGDFKVFMKQPIKDVNKFGLMMYSIPKTLDMITTANNQFTLEFEFRNGDQVFVPVYLPELDYYDMLYSQDKDASGTEGGDAMRMRSKFHLAFDEILQTTINWSIMNNYANTALLAPRACNIAMSRYFHYCQL